MKIRFALTAAALLSLAVGTVAIAQSTPNGVKTVTIGSGTAFVAASGTALYTFDRDMQNKSACNGRCAMIWPPLKADGDAHDMGAWTVVTRDDGTKQWAYQGKPLYTFARDKDAGDAKGDNFGPNGTHIWHVARP